MSWIVGDAVGAFVVFGAAGLAVSPEPHPVRIGTRASTTTAITAAARTFPSRSRLLIFGRCIGLSSFLAHLLRRPGASPGPHSSGPAVGGSRMRLENGLKAV